MRIILILCFALMCLIHGNGQDRAVSARVINDYLEIMTYVSIVVDDTVEIGRTNLNGFFRVDVPASTTRIVFRAVGMELAPIELTDKCNEVEIVMMLGSTYDFMSLRKVDKMLMKKI